MTDRTFSQAQPGDMLSRSRAVAALPAQRVSQGRSNWMALSRMNALRQPQDGAEAKQDGGSRVMSMDARLFAEPEDARLNGSTRSLTRRLLGLNVAKSRVREAKKLAPQGALPKGHAQVA